MGRKRSGSRNKGKHFSGKAQTESRCSQNDAPQQDTALMRNQACQSQKSADHEDSANFLCFSISCQEGTTFTDVYPRIQSALETALKKMYLTEKEILEIYYWPTDPISAENKTVRVKFRTERGKATNFHMQKEGAAVIYIQQMLRSSDCCLLASLLFPSFL